MESGLLNKWRTVAAKTGLLLPACISNKAAGCCHMSERPVQSDQNLLNESIVCDVCGRFGAIEFGDRKLCPDCYEGCGSCCPEFGKEEEKDETVPRHILPGSASVSPSR